VNQPPNNIQQGLRDKLLDAICFRLGQEVETAMPADISKETGKAILAEVLPNARFCLSRLNMEELQNDKCVDHEIESAARIARGFVDRIRAQRKRS
jgi:hypothetical protein